MINKMVSIIIPVYNCVSRIEKSVLSAVNQTYENIEILLIDDGSTDGSDIICDKLGERYSNIRVFHQKNQGPSGARNTGLEAFLGDYLFFLDSDDFLAPEYCKTMIKDIDQQKVDMVISLPILIDKKGDILPENKEIFFKKETVLYEKEILNELFGKFGPYFVVPWGKLIRRELFDNLRFDEGRRFEDEAIAHKLLGRNKKVFCTPYKGYYYIDNPQGFMNSDNLRLWFDVFFALENRIEYFANLKYGDLAAKTVDLLLYKLMEAYRLSTENKELRKAFRNEYRRCFSKYYFSNGGMITNKIGQLIFLICPPAYNFLYIHFYKKLPITL